MLKKLKSLEYVASLKSTIYKKLIISKNFTNIIAVKEVIEMTHKSPLYPSLVKIFSSYTYKGIK